MFSNIGNKIKTLATIVFWFGDIFSCIAFLVLFYFGYTTKDYNPFGVKLILIGIGVLIVGIFCTCVVSFLLYGFGELIEKTSNIEYKLDSVIEKKEEDY